MVSRCGAIDGGKLCRRLTEEGSRHCRGHQHTACYCCGEVDDPDGPGPVINTGFCTECTEAGCRESIVGSACLAARVASGGVS